MVESAGTAPAASILQGSNAPLCTPRDGVQSQCRPDLLGISNRCFHWISFLDRELRKARSFARWRGPAESNRYQCAGSAWHSQYTRSASLDGVCRRMVGNRGIEPRMRKGAGFTGPLSHQTWRYPNVLKACRRTEGVCWQGSQVLEINRGRHDRTRTYILDLRTVVLIQLSYVVITAGRGRRLIFRVRHPSTGSRARFRARSSAGSAAAQRQADAPWARTACGEASPAACPCAYCRGCMPSRCSPTTSHLPRRAAGHGRR